LSFHVSVHDAVHDYVHDHVHVDDRVQVRTPRAVGAFPTGLVGPELVGSNVPVAIASNADAPAFRLAVGHERRPDEGLGIPSPFAAKEYASGFGTQYVERKCEGRVRRCGAPRSGIPGR
jgi:hypothetical protein